MVILGGERNFIETATSVLSPKVDDNVQILLNNVWVLASVKWVHSGKHFGALNVRTVEDETFHSLVYNFRLVEDEPSSHAKDISYSCISNLGQHRVFAMDDIQDDKTRFVKFF